MENLERELYNLITIQLNEMAWATGYPLNRNVGIECYLEAFNDEQLSLNVKKENVEFFLTAEINGTYYEFNSDLTYEEISVGWTFHPLGSIKSLYDSIYKVFDKMEKNKFQINDFSRLNLEKRNEFAKIRNTIPKKIRERMEEKFLDYLAKYQEHLFIPVSGNIPKLEKPRLIYQIFENFPLDMIETASKIKSNFGPTEETLLKYGLDNKELEPGIYYPSESSMVSLFLGNYFHKLTQIKGYNSSYGDQSLREFVVSREKAFIGSHRINWPESLISK